MAENKHSQVDSNAEIYVFREGTGTRHSGEFTPVPQEVMEPEAEAQIAEIRARMNYHEAEQRRIDWDKTVSKLHSIVRRSRNINQFRYDVASVLDEIGLGRARDLACYGRYREAISELVTFIESQPELKLRIQYVPERFCADVLNDQPNTINGEEFNDNHGSIRTVQHLKKQGWGKLLAFQFGKASAINNVARELQDFDGGYLLLDSGIDEQTLFYEIAHELNTWILNGKFLGKVKGDWRYSNRDDTRFRDQQGNEIYANLEMDEYYNGTTGYRNPDA